MISNLFVLVAQTSAPELDVIELFLESGFMAKAVFAILAILSIASWSVMISKWLQYRRARSHGEEFLEIFRRSKRFSEVGVAARRLTGTPMVGLFQAGYAEIDAQVKNVQEQMRRAGDEGTVFRIKSLEGVERSLRRAIGVELGVLAKGTQLLATTASASPFIGLFGTVWGIMVAFGAISTGGSASITVVAPGIAEALINTAAGLAAAIPALVGYNVFGFRMRQLRNQMEDFALEFMNLTERNFT